MTLDEICKSIKTLIDTKGSLAKEKYLRDVVSTQPEVKVLLTMLLDSQYTFGLKKIKEIGVTSIKTIKTYDDLIKLTDKLISTNTNDALRTEVVRFLGMCTKESQDILIPFLQKTLKVGCTAKTFVKVFPGIISEHPIALAKSPTEAEIKIPCIVGVKYDGIRYTQVECSEKVQGKALTRDRNVMRFPRIQKGIQQLLKGLDGEWVIDGELETKDEDFDKVQGIVSSNIDTGYVVGQDTDLVLKVFDIIRYSDYIGETKSAPLEERLLLLSKLFLNNKPLGLIEAEHTTCYSIDKVKELTDKYIDSGLEGSIVKDPKAPYKKGKTNAWIKQKAINDCTLVCVGITEGTNKRAGKVGALMMESSDGLIKVKVGSGLTDEMVELFTKTPPIGKFFDVLFNQVSQAEDGQMSLRLPRLKGARIDVTEADNFEKIKSQHIGDMKLKE